MMKKTCWNLLALVSVFGMTGCEPPAYKMDVITHDFSGEIYFETAAASLELKLLNQDGQLVSLTGGLADVHLDYQRNYWNDWTDTTNHPTFYDQGKLALTVGDNRFEFTLPDGQNGFVSDQGSFSATSAESLQPLDIKFSSDTTLVNTRTKQSTSICTKLGCSKSSCTGSRTDITTYNKYRRDFTIQIGTSASTATDFVTGATFTGEEFYTNDTTSTGTCK